MNSLNAFLTIVSGENGRLLLKGLAGTLMLAASGWLLAFAIGTTLAVLRMTGVRPVGAAAVVFIEYQRNVPPLVHLFLWYFGVPQLLPDAAQDWLNAHHGEFLLSVVAIALYYGAYIAEDIRSGVRSVAHGQYEAARAIGLGHLGAMRRVILPQALRHAVPPLVSGSVLLLKTTALAMILGVTELTYVTKDIANRTFRTFDIFGVGTAIYILLALSLMWLGAMIAHRTRLPGR
ncbi:MULTISPECIES: amino acid ABC transporter permease [Cupriavidus]